MWDSRIVVSRKGNTDRGVRKKTSLVHVQHDLAFRSGTEKLGLLAGNNPAASA
jgi:hypothetical protein